MAWFLQKIVSHISAGILRGIIFRVSDSGRTKEVVTSIGKSIGWFASAAVLLVSGPWLQLGETGSNIVFVIARALAAVGGLLMAYRLADLVGARLEDSASKTESKLDDQLAPMIRKSLKALVTVGAVLFLIQSTGKDIMPLVTGLSVLGIGVSFAAKDSLANLFSGVFIIADAPFRVGDYILLDTGERGEVVHIGLRSTRILTRDDVEVSIPNGILGNTKIVNETGGPAPRQRVRVQVGVSYDSDLDQVREVLMKVAEAVDLVLDTPEPRVRFRAFGDSSLAFELLVWVAEPSVRGMALDALNTAVHRAFSEAGVQIPFPQRDLRILERS